MTTRDQFDEQAAALTARWDREGGDLEGMIAAALRADGVRLDACADALAEADAFFRRAGADEMPGTAIGDVFSRVHVALASLPECR